MKILLSIVAISAPPGGSKYDQNRNYLALSLNLVKNLKNFREMVCLLLVGARDRVIPVKPEKSVSKILGNLVRYCLRPQYH